MSSISLLNSSKWKQSYSSWNTEKQFTGNGWIFHQNDAVLDLFFSGIIFFLLFSFKLIYASKTGYLAVVKQVIKKQSIFASDMSNIDSILLPKAWHLCYDFMYAAIGFLFLMVIFVFMWQLKRSSFFMFGVHELDVCFPSTLKLFIKLIFSYK